MSVFEQILKGLDLISEQLWEDDLDDVALETLAKKTLKVSAQISVLQTLLSTSRGLLASEDSPGPKTALTRLSKVYKATFVKPSGKFEERWQKLRDIDCETFLFIAISYTDLELTKLNRIEFDYLIDAAREFRTRKQLPSNWMFRRRIRVVINSVAAEDFLMEYQNHQFPSNRSTKLQGDEEVHTGAQMFQDESAHGSQRLNHSRKRMCTGLEQQPAAACSPLLYDTKREMKYMYTNAPASNIMSHAPEPFRGAIQNSRLWASERHDGLTTTGCFAALFPKDYKQDVSFTIWCSQDDAYRLIEIFELQRAVFS
ncbi:uncharacterized protein RAG0_12619 [Rhynchosporium agropyri]|uniref:Uncharacterized protein n=2 Tax=Rhynchosporium TaxID=38037 RepID=A0A1E1MUE7_RHYSE|nr:uncharacterized protein RAG0_12619 [Rhynchosporium agropyri]CZT52681.1 uncharacterized protein RSE6_14036 [Rhynchosporium secalis]